MSLPGRPPDTLDDTLLPDSPTPRRLAAAPTLVSDVASETGETAIARTALDRLTVTGRDDYLVIGQFARGGIGRILRAHDPRLDRPVALKELLVNGRPVDEERFIREVLLTARLQHPGIVPVYAAGRWPSGEPFYAMKLVSGRSFDKVIAEATTLAQRLALLPHVLTIAETVAYAHSQRIIHRDLKPHNVLVGEFGETVVIDWGLAKELDTADPPPEPLTPTTAQPARDLTFVGAVVGTPGYMSPEQADGSGVDERTDVYALGVILYHVLSGSLPYDAADALGMVYKTVYEDPVPLRAREPDAPEELVAIVDKAMAKDLERRYRSARAFADDLRRFQTGQIVGAHRYTAWEVLRRFVRRHRALLSLAAVSVALIVAVTAVSFAQVRAERDAANDARDDARAARAEAERRADRLSFEQARLLVETDSPEALRLLHGVSPQADWRRTRQIAADLAQRGVPLVLRGHTAALSRAAFSPDGALLATTSDDCTLRVWDMSSRTSRAFYGHTSEVWRAAWSPDMRRVATSSKDATVRVWDVQTGEAQVLRSGGLGVRNVAFSPDGGALYASDDDLTLLRWDLAGGAAEVLHERCNGNNTRWTDRHASCIDGDTVVVFDLATGERATIATDVELGVSNGISPDGRWVTATTKAGGLWLYDRRAGAGGVLPRDPTRDPPNASFSQREPRFSPDSRRLLAPSDLAPVLLRDLESGRERWLAPHPGYTRRANFSADGALIVSVGGDSNVALWHDPTRTSYRLTAARAHLIDVQVSPDGQWIAGVGNDPRVFLWSPATFLRAQYTVAAPLRAGRPSTLGALVGLPSADGLEVVDVATMALRRKLPVARPLWTVGVAGDGSLGVTIDDQRELTVWSLATGEALLRRNLGGMVCLGGELVSESDGARFLYACNDGHVLWIDLAAREPVAVLGTAEGYSPVLLAPELSAALVGTGTGDLLVSDGPGAPLRRLDHYDYPIRALARIPGRREFVVTSEEVVERRDLGDGPRTRYPGHRLQVGRVLVSQDGRRVVTISRDNIVRVFDRETAALRLELFSPELLERTGALSPDGERIAAVVTGGEVLVWDLRDDSGDPARREFRRLRVGSPVNAAQFEPDGALLLVTRDSVARWRDDLPDEPEQLREWIAARVDADEPPKPQPGCAAPE